ncbi:MAG: hypothetical protein ABJB65_06450 [Chloroflexota bacterium]
MSRQIACVRLLVASLFALVIQLALAATAAACTGGGPWPHG